MSKTIDIVFDGPPGSTAGRFVEVEDHTGKSISLGDWVKRDDGFWVLRIPDVVELQERDRLLDALEAGGVDNWDGYDFALEDAGI